MTRQPTLHVISAGAARGLVRALAPDFEAAHKVRIEGTFGAVGAMRERLEAGAPCDVLVLTAALIDAMAARGRLLAGSVAPLGAVRTGVAVPAGDPLPDVHDAAALAAALCAASVIHFPDPARATAGIHFMRVIERLGLAARLAPRLRTFANGAEAMAALATLPGSRALGCTQVTEILYTPGVALAAPLPPQFELATVYTAAVPEAAAHPGLGREFVRALTGVAGAAPRVAGGFEPLA
jgi:molybdate transport system substrate-binding protein